MPPTTELPSSLRRRASEVAPVGPVGAELNATGFGLGVAYFVPFTPQFNGVGRIGAAQNRGKLSGNDGETGYSSSKNSTQAYFGIGVAYNVTPNFANTAEGDFSRVKYGTENDYDSSNVQLWSFGLRYLF